MRARSTWRRQHKALPITPQPTVEPWYGPFIGFGLGAVVCLAGSIYAGIWLTTFLDDLLKQPPAEVPWEARIEESDTSWPAVPYETEPDPVVAPVEEEPKAPKGRCLKDSDCRSGGRCVIEAGASNGTCAQCENSSQCPGEELCIDGACASPVIDVSGFEMGEPTITPTPAIYWRGIHLELLP